MTRDEILMTTREVALRLNMVSVYLTEVASLLDLVGQQQYSPALREAASGYLAASRLWESISITHAADPVEIKPPDAKA